MFGLLDGLLQGNALNPMSMLQQSGPFGQALAQLLPQGANSPAPVAGGTQVASNAPIPPSNADMDENGYWHDKNGILRDVNGQAITPDGQPAPSAAPQQQPAAPQVQSGPQQAAPSSGFQPGGTGFWQSTPVKTATPQATAAPANGTSQTPAAAPQGQPNQMDDFLTRAANSIGQMESSNDYGAMGKWTKHGDRAYGRYQVMGANIPSWTKQWTGTQMTPQQFLADHAAQDAVFRGQFGQYAKQFGPQLAAHAWFAGPGGIHNLKATDINGMSVDRYGKQFMAGMRGAAPQVQVADATSPSSITQSPGSTGASNPGTGTQDAGTTVPQPGGLARALDTAFSMPHRGGIPASGLTPPQNPYQQPAVDLGAQEVANDQALATQRAQQSAAQTQANHKAARAQGTASARIATTARSA